VKWIVATLTLLAHWLGSFYLISRLDWAWGLLANSLVVVALTAIAGRLLTTAEIGAVTWRNRLAGLLLPWTVPLVVVLLPIIILAAVVVVSYITGRPLRWN